MALFHFVEWLLLWFQERRAFVFDWDAGNSMKSLIKHGVSIEEIETIFEVGQIAPLGVQTSPEVTEERLGILGLSSRGRVILVVFTLRNGKVRPISGRVANRKEREFYAKTRKAIERI